MYYNHIFKNTGEDERRREGSAPDQRFMRTQPELVTLRKFSTLFDSLRLYKLVGVVYRVLDLTGSDPSIIPISLQS
jgi:hypothetical protein